MVVLCGDFRLQRERVKKIRRFWKRGNGIRSEWKYEIVGGKKEESDVATRCKERIGNERFGSN